MPFNRKYGRKRNIPRRRKWYKKSKIMRPLQPKVYHFKRVFEEIVDLNQTDAGQGWIQNDNGVYKQFVYALNELPGYTDFTNLFQMYKLTGASVKMYFSNTNSEERDTQSFSNSQLLMRIAPNPSGTTASVLVNPLNQQWFNECQATKRRLCLNAMGKPLATYTKLKQLSEVYHNVGNSDYQVVSPKWISTGENATPHYGLNCRLDRVSGEPLTSGFNNSQKVRIMTTLYVACKQVV